MKAEEEARRERVAAVHLLSSAHLPQSYKGNDFQQAATEAQLEVMRAVGFQVPGPVEWEWFEERATRAKDILERRGNTVLRISRVPPLFLTVQTRIEPGNNPQYELKKRW